MQPEPILDIAHLGHVELLTNKPEASLRFFVDVLGLSESGREGDSVYLRAFDDYEFHSLKLTAAKTTGIRHAGYRAFSPQALARRILAIEALGAGVGWNDGDLGHGPAYRFRDPDGHEFEIYYETRRYEPPPEQRPSLKNQAQRTPNRAIAPRRLDHFNLLARDVGVIRDFIPSALGSRITEMIQLDDGTVGGCWFTVNN
jgi:catechol 2,3-dioxygenase